MNKLTYCFLYIVLRMGMFFYHPIFKVTGRENVPKEGRLVICCNHSGMADPIWLILALRLGHIPRIMAKKEVMKVPVLGPLLAWVGAFGVDRNGTDVAAIKKGLKILKEEEQLLIFPEGTRVKPGQQVEAKRGALMLAAKTDSPVLPVYLTAKRHPFSPMKCVIGTPYRMTFQGPKATEEELEAETRQLMQKIYQLGE